MKFKAFLAIIFSIGAMAISVPSYAIKVAEYGDPIIGNSYNNCTFTGIYSTGGPGFLYNEYEISCPSFGIFEVGVYKQTQPYESCTFTPGDDSYYVSYNNCDNW